MNGRVWIFAVPLVLMFLFYPITKPLYASLSSQGDSIAVSGDYLEGGIELSVSRDYQALITEENGQIGFELGRALGGNGEKAFNSNARFVVGSLENPVFTVTNQSDKTISVRIESTKAQGAILLHADKNRSIAPGETVNFYFEVNTSGADIGQIRAQLQIYEAKD